VRTILKVVVILITFVVISRLPALSFRSALPLHARDLRSAARGLVAIAFSTPLCNALKQLRTRQKVTRKRKKKKQQE
jgi:hypothetical protein